MTTRTTGVIRVAVVDDQPLLVSAFSALVAAQPDMEVVLEAVNGRQAVEGLTARATGPHGGADLVLMDLRMPVLDGVSAIRELRAAPATASLRVLVLTTFDDEELVLASLGAGAHGFLLKDADPQSLVDAVRTVHEGQSLLSPQVLARLVARMPRTTSTGTSRSTWAGEVEALTPRQREVLLLIARGLSNTEIEVELGITRATCRSHITALLARLGARDRAQLVIAAYEAGLISPR